MTFTPAYTITISVTVAKELEHHLNVAAKSWEQMACGWDYAGPAGTKLNTPQPNNAISEMYRANAQRCRDLSMELWNLQGRPQR